MHLGSLCRHLKRSKNESIVVTTTDYHYDISLYYSLRATSPSSDKTCSSPSSSPTVKTPVDGRHGQPPNDQLATTVTDSYETCSPGLHRSPSSSTEHWPYEESINSDAAGKCKQRSPPDYLPKTRWERPESIQHHFVYLQSPARSVKAMLNDYYMGTEEYTQAANAACIPTAKLERAKAEHKWVMKRCSDRTRLLAPHLQEQVQAAQKKISAAEKECELVMQERLKRAQSLSDLGRF